MNSWLVEIPTIVSWLLHVAVCVTFVSVAGGVALWACKSLSASKACFSTRCILS